MAKLPYMKFYPSDWLNDPALRVVSHAAKGMWIDMLCLMWISPERGAFRFISGRNPEPNVIAKALGLRLNRYHKLFTELHDAGVLSLTDDGCVVSRRMLRDEELRREAEVNGARGGNPKLLEGVNPPLNPPGYPAPDVRQNQNQNQIQNTNTHTHPNGARKGGMGVLTDWKKSDLTDDAKLIERFREAVAAGVIPDSEAMRLRFVAEAERVLSAKGVRNAAVMFVANVRKGLPDRLTDADEDRGRARLKRMRAGKVNDAAAQLAAKLGGRS